MSVGGPGTPFIMTDANVGRLFKIKYGKWADNYVNKSRGWRSRIKNKKELVGEKTQFAGDPGFIGGASAGSLGEENRGETVRPEYAAKKLYVTHRLDRASVMQATDAGAFVEGQKHNVKKMVEKYGWLEDIAFWGAGDGSLGVATALTGTGTTVGSSHVFTISAATFQRRSFPKRQIIQTSSAGTRLFEITAVDVSTRQVTAVALQAGTAPGTTDTLYIQQANGQMPISMSQVLSFASSTLYGVTYDSYDWSPTRINAASQTISVDLLNELVLSIHEKCGKAPTALYMNHTNMRKLLNSIADMKYFMSPGEVKGRTADLSFSSLVFNSIEGAIPVIVEPYLKDANIAALNEPEIVLNYVPGTPGFVEQSGSPILISQSTDEYLLRYASYLNLETIPTYHGEIYGLA